MVSTFLKYIKEDGSIAILLDKFNVIFADVKRTKIVFPKDFLYNWTK